MKVETAELLSIFPSGEVDEWLEVEVGWPIRDAELVDADGIVIRELARRRERRSTPTVARSSSCRTSTAHSRRLCASAGSSPARSRGSTTSGIRTTGRIRRITRPGSCGRSR